MNSYKGIIFDLDGTLANTLPDLSTAMNSMLRQNSLPERSDEELLGAINMGARQFVKLSLPEEYQNDEDFITARHREYTSYYDKCYADRTFLYSGVYDAVKYLCGKIKLAVFSNKQHDHCKALIEKLFDDTTFDFILGQTELPTKPDPIGAFMIAGKLDLRPSEILYIGDSHVDMITACAAGMYPVGVSWGYRPPSVLLEYGAKSIISDAKELKTLTTL